MKKVLIVSTVGLIYDGITSVITSYLQAMDLHGLDIYVVGTIAVMPNIRKQIEDCGCKVVDFPNRRADTFSYFCSLIKFIRKNNIEIIHAHGNSGTLAIEMVAAWLGGCKKRIAHSHNTKCDNIKADKLLRPLFNFFYTDGLACSKESGAWLFGKRNFKVLTNGRDINKYKFNSQVRKKIRDSLGIKDEIVIGHVGGFFEQKNHIFLVEIYKELRNIEPNCKLFMIGDGPLKPEIEKLCGAIGVIFTGAVDNIPDYLNAMDGMILPSLFEGLPLVAIEWQMNGIPCLLSDTITKDCKLSIFVNYMSLNSSARAWAETILQLVKENNRNKNYSNEYELLKRSKFNICNSAKLLEQIYRN